MPIKYTYLGHPTNLGRFGYVKRGDVLTLTDHEEESILSDSENKGRFQPFREGSKEVDGVGLNVPPDFHKLPPAHQTRLLKKLEDDKRRREEEGAGAVDPRSGTAAGGGPETMPEDVRRAKIEAANADAEKQQWRDATKAELLAEVERMKRDEGLHFEFKTGASRATILTELLRTKGLDDSGVVEDEEQG